MPRRAKRHAAIVRFPCRHTEPEDSALARVRSAGGTAVWVGCRRCNVIAVAYRAHYNPNHDPAETGGANVARTPEARQ